MRLDDLIAAQKRSACLWAAFIGGVLLAMFVRPFGAWRMTAMCMPGAITQWLISSSGCRQWAAFFGGCIVAGSVIFDYLFRQAAPVVSPYLFCGVWFAVMTPFGFWLARKEQWATANGGREETTRA